MTSEIVVWRLTSSQSAPDKGGAPAPPFSIDAGFSFDAEHRRADETITGEFRSKIDRVLNAFWAGAIANPIEMIEQIISLLFMRGLNEAG